MSLSGFLQDDAAMIVKQNRIAKKQGKVGTPDKTARQMLGQYYGWGIGSERIRQRRWIVVGLVVLLVGGMALWKLL